IHRLRTAILAPIRPHVVRLARAGIHVTPAVHAGLVAAGFLFVVVALEHEPGHAAGDKGAGHWVGLDGLPQALAGPFGDAFHLPALGRLGADTVVAGEVVEDVAEDARGAQALGKRVDGAVHAR